MRIMPRGAAIGLAVLLALAGVAVCVVRVASGTPIASSVVSALALVLGVAVPVTVHQWAARRRLVHADA